MRSGRARGEVLREKEKGKEREREGKSLIDHEHENETLFLVASFLLFVLIPLDLKSSLLSNSFFGFLSYHILYREKEIEEEIRRGSGGRIFPSFPVNKIYHLWINEL